MKKILLFTIIFIKVNFSQYNVISPYLNNPELAIPYVDSCAQFWLMAYDENIGGFFTNIDRFGNVITGWGTNKNMITQSRDAYGFVRAYMLTGDDAYLQKAREALDFMYQHAWDGNNGGWFNDININGNPNNLTEDKTAFNQHYALLGISAYYEATLDTIDWNWLMNGYTVNENNLWDDRPDYFGYYDLGNFNWSSVNGKSFNATVDAITTHLLYLYLMTGDESYKNRLLQMADNILNRLVASMEQQEIGFVELYNSNWTWNNSNTMTIMGHVLKAAWCLGRINQLFPDTSYISGANKLIQNVLDKGYDHELGGPYKDFNRVTGEMLMWGNPDTAKAWWQMEQAVTAGLELYDITGNEDYLQMADETLNFFMNYFVDHEFSEVYENRTRYGDETWGTHKGNGSKAGYHSIELGYYVYLYGSLLLNHQPVTLFYNFLPVSYDRVVVLNPLAFPDNKLKITSVLLDNLSYNDFDALSRTLNIPNGVGGEFKVTFEPYNTTGVAMLETGPVYFKLYQNYPNPFNPSTKIKYTVPQDVKNIMQEVSLKVYDVLGNEIAILADGEKPAGDYIVEFNGNSLSSGVYFYTLRINPTTNPGQSFMYTRKMLLIK